jgi:hypothetical protein
MRLTVLAVILVAGCAPRMHLSYPGLGLMDSSAQMLGPVSACAGGLCCGEEDGCQWPLSLVLRSRPVRAMTVTKPAKLPRTCQTRTSLQIALRAEMRNATLARRY